MVINRYEVFVRQVHSQGLKVKNIYRDVSLVGYGGPERI